MYLFTAYAKVGAFATGLYSFIDLQKGGFSLLLNDVSFCECLLPHNFVIYKLQTIFLERD